MGSGVLHEAARKGKFLIACFFRSAAAGFQIFWAWANRSSIRRSGHAPNQAEKKGIQSI